MRRLAVLGPIAVLAAVLMARRQLRRRRAASLPPAPSPAAASPPLPAPTSTAPLAPGSRFVSVAWTIAAAPDDRAELRVRYACTDQMELDRVDAQETPTQVFVTVLMRWHPPEGGRLAQEREREAAVSLSAPLGARALVHAPIDLPAPAPAPGSEPDSPPLYP